MFQFLKNLFTPEEKKDLYNDLWKNALENFINKLSDSLEQSKSDYYNSDNYPLYQQEYYILTQELNNYSTKQELDTFYNKVSKVFESVKNKYDTTNLEEKEKNLLYYDDTKSLNFYFFDTYYKLLRSIWNKYKKIKSMDMAFDIFQQIVLWAIRDIEKMPDLFDTMRINDVKFLIKEYWKRWDVDMQNNMENLEETIIMKSRAEQEKKVQEELKWSIKSEKENYESFKKRLLWEQIWWKKVLIQWDEEIYESCKVNAELWWIPANEKFPSWHMYPPFQRKIDLKNEIWPCNCNIIYSTQKN